MTTDEVPLSSSKHEFATNFADRFAASSTKRDRWALQDEPVLSLDDYDSPSCAITLTTESYRREQVNTNSEQPLRLGVI